jgi:hypothetical protein
LRLPRRLSRRRDPESADRFSDLGLCGLITVILAAGAVFPESPRGFQVLVLAAMLLALWTAGARLARRLVPDWEPLSRMVASFTFAAGLAVVPATWMGHFGVLRPAVFLVWTAAAYLLSRFWKDPTRITSSSSLRSLLPLPSWVRIERALLLAAALAIALAGLREVRGLRYLPPVSYDDLSYHLSTVATWIRHGDLRMIRFSMGDPSTPFYPILGEMSAWVLIAPFRDSDVAARWAQLPFALFSFLAAAAVARRLGLSNRDAALAALSYAGIHEIFPFLALMAGNDHSLCFFTLAALDGSLAFARRPQVGEAVAAGAALGLLLATKYIGVLFAPVVVAVLILARLIERRRPEEAVPRAPARPLATLAALLCATAVVTGGYIYLRNWATAGNPIFPAPVRIFGIEIFPGRGGILASERADSPEYQIAVWEFLTRRPQLFGFYFPFTLLPAALLAPPVALVRRRWREALLFSLPAVFFLQFLFMMHDHRDNRYFLPGIALAAVAFAWLLARLGPWAFLPRCAVLLWIAGQAMSRFDGPVGKKMLALLILLAAGTLVETAWSRWRTRAPSFSSRFGSEAWRRIAAVGLLLTAAAPLARTVAKYQEEKLARQPGPLALERLARPPGSRVAYAGSNTPYLFFGSRLQNDVEIVPRSRALEAQTYRWGSRLARPYAIGPYRVWRANLVHRGIEFVVIQRSRWENPERQWMLRRTADFRRVYEDRETEIWQVVPGRRPAADHHHADPAAVFGQRAGAGRGTGWRR